jgi:hypothetical protein
MKKNTTLVLGLFACILLGCGNKKEKDIPSQNNDFLVSMSGIDSLKLEMTKGQLEKLLNTQLSLPHCATDSGGDTINVKYRNMDMTLFMYGSADSSATLRSIQTTNPSCKTAAGIGAGADKMNVINSYEDYTKYVAPEIENYPVRSNTKFAVAVRDTLNTGALVFHIINKKVVSVEVVSYYEFE